MEQEIVCPKCGYSRAAEDPERNQVCPRCFYGIDTSGSATAPDGDSPVPHADPTNPYAPPRETRRKRFRSPLKPAGWVVIALGLIVLGWTIWVFISTGWFYGFLLAIAVAILIAGFFLLTGG